MKKNNRFRREIARSGLESADCDNNPDSVTAQYTDTNRNSQFACANGYERHCRFVQKFYIIPIRSKFQLVNTLSPCGGINLHIFDLLGRGG